MKSTKLILSVVTLVVFCSTAMAAEQKIVEGKIVKVVPSQREIYVYDGEEHEYYFTEKTKILESQAEVLFAELKTGQRVRVTANKIGKRLDPTTVEILE